MFKGNSFVLVFSILMLIFLIFLSEIPLIVQWLLSLLAFAFLFPGFRDKVLKHKMRKVRVALLTSITFSIGLLFSSLPMVGVEAFSFITIISFTVVLFYSLLGNLVMGLPVSILADYLSEKTNRFRAVLSAIIHLGFGFATFFIAQGLFLGASICSALFFIWDEVTRRKVEKKERAMTSSF
ncbi:hypothetical protein [Bacillus sp. RAR_GA_16]|uniref:hypothetical protein n=1 Tax=Bacillus sp. RAR_GA_16 TaxID=2876774 RepID=UPI001CCC7730|nr:hypothetical protein [Bacillus sp. RAR_GA_16]MCA0172637.1 hypothetical protein [Bacillus sp. RAR_GA_16]